MLVRFVLKNWKSCRDESELSLSATGEKQHAETLANIKKFRLKLLPLTAIYGPNASGKSNLIAALSFAKKFITNGLGVDEPIPVKRFKLDGNSEKRPLEMQFDLLINELIYEYKFSVTGREVFSESLSLINSSSRKVLFSRIGQSIELGKGIKEDAMLALSAQTTRSNVLFLTNSVLQNFKVFRAVYDWFDKTLVIENDNSKYRFLPKCPNSTSAIKELSRLLEDFDTGGNELVTESIDAASLPIANEDLRYLRAQLKEGEEVLFRHSLTGALFVLSKAGDELEAKKVMACCKTPQGSIITFSMEELSFGVNRLIDLAPALLSLCHDRSRVVFIDDLDRGLHTHVTQSLIKRFLTKCNAVNRNQLIFTVHDVQLMDHELLRRDEIWLMDREPLDGSSLTALSEFKEIRNDHNLIRSYLSGRVRGLPKILA